MVNPDDQITKIQPAPNPLARAIANEQDPATCIGRYEILERVGMGGMAEAFRARAKGPGGYQRDLIIKRILPHLAEDPTFVHAFVDEAKILGMLNHPNIVGIYDFGEDNGRHYLALEYLDGPSLAQILASLRAAQRPMPIGVVAFVAREVCHGLAAVHNLRTSGGPSLTVIHRDVSPSNVMTTTSGAVKLLDFGIAKFSTAAPVTQHGQIKGKVGYLAPEQIRGGAIDGRVDLFSLGVVLHEMLRLDHLFYGEGGDLATIYRIMEMPIAAPSTFRDDVPPALDAIALRALAREPNDRFATALDMARALDAIVRECGFGIGEFVEFVSALPKD